MTDGYLRSVPSDADPHDGRLYDPTQSDTGTTLNAAVAFAGLGSVAVNATAIRAAAISMLSTASFAANATALRAAAMSSTGVGSFASAATAVRAAAVAFSGADAASFAASAVRRAALSFTGSATFAASATLVVAAPPRAGGARYAMGNWPGRHAARIAFQGARPQFRLRAQAVRGAQLSLAVPEGRFTAAPTIVRARQMTIARARATLHVSAPRLIPSLDEALFLSLFDALVSTE